MSNSRPETICLTLIAPGGVSLGAYFAGAVAQLGVFLARWEVYIQDKPHLPRIHLDVISGASAGSLTGAMLFQFIGTNYYETEGGSLDDRLKRWVQRNFDAWCGEGVQVEELLNHEKSAERTSVFSSASLEKAAQKAIKDLDVRLPSEQYRLLYSCTVTALSPRKFKGEFPGMKKPTQGTPRGNAVHLPLQTRADHFAFRVRRLNQDGRRTSLCADFQESNHLFRFEEMSTVSEMGSGVDAANRQMLWERFRWAALSSGSFPLAWNPVRFPRLERGYFSKKRGKSAGPCYEEIVYSDGGIINNNPVNRSFEILRHYLTIAEAQDPDLHSERFCVFISGDPEPRVDSDQTDSHLRGGARIPLSSPLRSGQVPVFETLGILYEAMREQSFNEDIKATLEVNKSLQMIDEHGLPLVIAQVKAASRVQNKTIKNQARLRIKECIDERHKSPEWAWKWVDRTIAHARLRFERLQLLNGLDDDQQAAATAQVALFDFVYGYATKRPVGALRIIPEKQLYGAFMGAFGGFLKRDYMVRDFLSGWEAAGRALDDWGSLKGQPFLLPSQQAVCEWLRSSIGGRTDYQADQTRTIIQQALAPASQKTPQLTVPSKLQDAPLEAREKVPGIIEALIVALPIPSKPGQVAMGSGAGTILLALFPFLVGWLPPPNLLFLASAFVAFIGLGLVVAGGLLNRKSLAGLASLAARHLLKGKDGSEHE